MAREILNGWKQPVIFAEIADDARNPRRAGTAPTQVPLYAINAIIHAIVGIGKLYRYASEPIRHVATKQRKQVLSTDGEERAVTRDLLELHCFSTSLSQTFVSFDHGFVAGLFKCGCQPDLQSR